MKDFIHYLHLQMRLEGIGLDDKGRLVSISPQDEELPLVLVARLADGHPAFYLKSGLPTGLDVDLRAELCQLRFPNMDGLLGALRTYGLQPDYGHFKSYIFPKQYTWAKTGTARPYSADDLRVKAFDFDGFPGPVFAVEKAGVILSACVSSRKNDECAEAWVVTAPDQRRKELAMQVVAAWAKGMIREGLIPFYSHTLENTASTKLAEKLGLIPVFEEICIGSL
jgi:hypothetical protein